MANGDSTLSGEMWSGGESAMPSEPPPQTNANASSSSQTPPSSQVPADTSDEQKALQRSIDSNRIMQNEIMEAHRKTMEEFTQNQQMIQEAQRKYQDALNIPSDTDPVPPIDNPTRDQRMAGIQTNTTWPAVLGSLGMMLAGALGGKGHHASITGMSFLGGMMQAYSKGQSEAVKQHREEWWRQMEYNHQVIQDRLANYRAALQDRRLNSQQALEVFKTYVTAYGDSKYMAAAERGDLNTINRQLVTDETALARLRKEARDTEKAFDTLTKQRSPRGKQWEDEAFDRWSAKHDGYMPSTQQEKAEAFHDYPRKQFDKEFPEMIYQKDSKTGEYKIVPKFPSEREAEGGHLFKRAPREPGTAIEGGQREEDSYGKSLAPESMDDYFQK